MKERLEETILYSDILYMFSLVYCCCCGYYGGGGCDSVVVVVVVAVFVFVFVVVVVVVLVLVVVLVAGDAGFYCQSAPGETLRSVEQLNNMIYILQYEISPK